MVVRRRTSNDKENYNEYEYLLTFPLHNCFNEYNVVCLQNSMIQLTLRLLWNQHVGCWWTSTKPSATIMMTRRWALINHDDVIKWKLFPSYWPFVRGIHRSLVNSLHNDQWRGALVFSLICTWINGWVNNGKAGDLRRHRAHYDVAVMHLLEACIIIMTTASFRVKQRK